VGRSALIVNPVASRVTAELVSDVERELAIAETFVTQGPGHATELATRIGRDVFDLLYVLSGDGGYNEAVNGCDGRVPIGFLPGGATSVLPRALGLPRDPRTCARALAGPTARRRISLGRVNGRRFTFSAGLGLDAELVRAVDRYGRRTGRRPGDRVFVWSLLRILGSRRGRFDPALTVVGRGRAAFALVANCDPYTYLGRLSVHVAPEARFELGLDLVAPVALRAAQVPKLAYWVLVRAGQQRSDGVLYVHDAGELRVECDGPTALQVDGEDLGDVSEAVFEAERDALEVLVPAAAGLTKG
jgi:diacylglycerol kinase family enzyme